MFNISAMLQILQIYFKEKSTLLLALLQHKNKNNLPALRQLIDLYDGSKSTRKHCKEPNAKET
jgi:hypothetical protein